MKGVDELAARYEVEFNRRDHVALAALYDLDGRWMAASGGLHVGRGDIRAALGRLMAEGPPELTFDERARVVSGRHAVSRGLYRLDYPEATGMAPIAGAYLNVLRDGDEGWRIVHQLTNFDTEVPPGAWLGDRREVEALPAQGSLVSMLSFTVRDVGLSGGPTAWAPDAQVALPGGGGWVSGPPSIRRSVRGGSAWWPDVVVHDLETRWLDGGLAIDIGWYEIGGSGPAPRWGSYTLLARRAPRGLWMIHWLAATASPPPAPKPTTEPTPAID
jgi:ketosteroid isomerase-like protein